MWITPSEVAVLVRTDLSTDEWIDGLILHAQGLAENEIGPQDEPVSAGLKAVLANIVARMWQAGHSAEVNPGGFQSETVGPFTYQDTRGGTSGLGLTNREIKALKGAVGKLGVGVLSTTRGELETPPRWDHLEDALDPVDQALAAQADFHFPS